MHDSLRAFLDRMRAAYPRAFCGEKVAEFGSYDINGTPRPWFKAKEYLGVDHRAGPSVDVVCLAENFAARPLEYFDTVISTSMLEHDPRWIRSLSKMARLVVAGGSLIITAAGIGWPPHEVHTSPGTDFSQGSMPAGVYYENVRAYDVASVVLSMSRWEETIVEDDPVSHDVRFFFYKKIKGANPC